MKTLRSFYKRLYPQSGLILTRHGTQCTIQDLEAYDEEETQEAVQIDDVVVGQRAFREQLHAYTLNEHGSTNILEYTRQIYFNKYTLVHEDQG